MTKRYHEPSDFKVGTVFIGAVNFQRFKIRDIYHERTLDKNGKVQEKKELTVSFIGLENGKLYSLDMETLCHCNVDITDEKENVQ